MTRKQTEFIHSKDNTEPETFRVNIDRLAEALKSKGLDINRTADMAIFLSHVSFNGAVVDTKFGFEVKDAIRHNAFTKKIVNAIWDAYKIPAESYVIQADSKDGIEKRDGIMPKYNMLFEIDSGRFGMQIKYHKYDDTKGLIRYDDTKGLSRLIGQDDNYIDDCIKNGVIGVIAALKVMKKADIHPYEYIKDYGKMVPYNNKPVYQLTKRVNKEYYDLSKEISSFAGLLSVSQRDGKINIVFAKFLEALYGIKCYTEETEQPKEPEKEQQKEEQQKAAVKEEPKESKEPAIDYDRLAMAIALAFDFALERYRNGSRGAYNPLFKRFIEEAGKTANAEKGDHE